MIFIDGIGFGRLGRGSNGQFSMANKVFDSSNCGGAGNSSSRFENYIYYKYMILLITT